jgi:hypothetical protein
MRAKYLSGVVSAVFGMTAVAGAGAETISIGVGPAGSITTVASGPANSAPVVFSAPDNSWSTTATDVLSGADLGSTAISVPPLLSGTLTIWVTETGIDIGPPPQKLLITSGFTQNFLATGEKVTEKTFFDAGNHAFGTTTPLDTAVFDNSSGSTTAPGGSSFPLPGTTLDVFGMWSLTEEYIIEAPLGVPPNALSTISLQTADQGKIPFIPEPSTWTMMAIGFAGLGYAAYGRSRKSRASASIV